MSGAKYEFVKDNDIDRKLEGLTDAFMVINPILF